MPVAAAVYFGVAETLTNAVRHSGADKVQIGIGYAGGMLRATIIDDGVGRRRPGEGTGLPGVERRLAAFDGILAVSSPAGGPSIMVIEVPCELSNSGAARKQRLAGTQWMGGGHQRVMADENAHLSDCPHLRCVGSGRGDRGLPCALSSVKTSSCCAMVSCGSLRRTGSKLSRPWGALPSCSRRLRS